MAKKLKIGNKYFNPETGMLESTAGSDSTNTFRALEFIRRLEPRRAPVYQRSLFDRIKNSILNGIDKFTEDILPVFIWIIYILFIILAWVQEGFIVGIIVGVVGFFLTPIVAGILAGILALLSLILGKLLYSKTTAIISCMLIAGMILWQFIPKESSVSYGNLLNKNNEYVIYSDVANIRSSPSDKDKTNIRSSLPLGTKITTLGEPENGWHKVNYDGSFAYISQNVVINQSDYAILSTLLDKNNNWKSINTIRDRKALLGYFKNNNYSSEHTSPNNNSNIWNIGQCITGKNIYLQKIDIKSIEVLGIILENITSEERKLIAFIFGSDEALLDTYEWQVKDRKGIQWFTVQGNQLYVVYEDIKKNVQNEKHGSQQLETQRDTRNKDAYTGEQNQQGRPHGMGTYIWANGDRLEASWVDGIASGHGTFTSHEGWEYIGTFENTKFHGIGTVYYRDGSNKTFRFVKGEVVENIK